MSCSDPSEKCLSFVKANHGMSMPTHWRRDLDTQRCNGPCMMHPYASEGCDSCPVGRGSVDFSLTGSPCHPFSQQRSTRFDGSSVCAHHEFETTMKSLLEWADRYCPRVWIMEQVRGFDLPFSKAQVDPSDTPLKRRVAAAAGVRGLPRPSKGSNK